VAYAIDLGGFNLSLTFLERLGYPRVQNPILKFEDLKKPILKFGND